jgi:hypothetical protein
VRDFDPANVGWGSGASNWYCLQHFRLTPRSRRKSGHSFPPLGASSGLMQCSKFQAYSITSSVRKRKDSGTVSPSALAVLRLTTRLNLTGCSTGMSAGFAPRKIFNNFCRAPP